MGKVKTDQQALSFNEGIGYAYRVYQLYGEDGLKNEVERRRVKHYSFAITADQDDHNMRIVEDRFVTGFIACAVLTLSDKCGFTADDCMKFLNDFNFRITDVLDPKSEVTSEDFIRTVYDEIGITISGRKF